MNKIIEYVITAVDKTQEAVGSAIDRVKSFGSDVLSNLANIKAGLEMAWGVAQKFGSIFQTAISEAFKVERAQAEFETLLKSVDSAKEHIEQLRDMASKTPLTFDDLASASKQLLSFGMDVKDVMPSLQTLGDISMGNSEKFKGLALVFAQVQSAGKLMGQDLLQMINQGFNPLTIIAQETGKSMSELKDMMSDGAISFEMVAAAMKVATSEGGLFNNAMKKSSETGEGLISTLKDKWTMAVAEFGEAFTDSAKGGIQLLIDKIGELIENGTIDVWANEVAESFSSLMGVAEKCASAVSKVVSVYNSICDAAERAGSAVGAFIGTMSEGGNIEDATKSASEASAVTLLEQQDEAMERSAKNAEIMADAMERAKAGANAIATSGMESGISDAGESAKTISQMIAEAEKEERKKVEDEISEKRKSAMLESVSVYESAMKTAEQTLAKAKQSESAAQTRLSTANSKVEELWSYYEDPEKYQEYIKSNAEKAAKRQSAMERFAQDYESLQHVGNSYLTDDLTMEMASALKEQAAAEEYSRTCAEKTAEACQLLEQLNERMENARI